MEAPATLYRRRAEECDKLAEGAMTADHRRTILEIAATWRAMADQHERLELDEKD